MTSKELAKRTNTRKALPKKSLSCVGATGFEPATTWSQTRRATGLRYTPFFFSECKGIKKYWYTQIFRHKNQRKSSFL